MHCFRGHLSRGAELGAEAGAVPRCDRGNARSSECGSEDEPANEQNVEPRRFRAFSIAALAFGEDKRRNISARPC